MEQTQQTIHAKKEFTANVNNLYDAWVNPDKLKEWWQPAGNKLVHVLNEVQEGGAIKYEFANESGEKTIVITGEYKEVKPAEKLVYSWDWHMPDSDNYANNHFELTIEFSSEGAGSLIQVMQANEDVEESIQPTKRGWEDELESLNKFLS